MLTEKELESAAALHLGTLLFRLSNLELNLGLELGDYKDMQTREANLNELANTGLKQKLDIYLRHVNQIYADDPIALKAFQDWFQSADLIRLKRNDLVHGRWGIVANRQQVVNVVGLPGASKQTETCYTIAVASG